VPNAIDFLRHLRDLQNGWDDLPGLVRNIAGCAENLRWSPPDRQILSSLLSPSAEHAAVPVSIYRDSILRLLSGQPAASARLLCTQEQDDLLTDDYHWPVDKIVNLALLSNTAPSKSVALVTSVRNEGLGLLEWVAYHLAIGIEHIFVYWNDNDDGSTSLINALDGAGYITAIENVISGDVPIQKKAFEHSLHLLPELRHYKWAFYLDPDEFFVPRATPDFDVASLIARIEARSADEQIDAVMFNWKWFGSENTLRRTPGLLLERFVHSKPNRHIKCLVRPSAITSMNHAHFPIMSHPERIVRSDLNRVDDNEHTTGKTSPVYELGQINHYWNKSFEEFLLKKYRGRGSSKRLFGELELKSFFDWGGNAYRGEPDPPSESMLRKTKRNIAEMKSHSDIQYAQLETERCNTQKIARLASEIDIAALHQTLEMSTARAFEIHADGQNGWTEDWQGAKMKKSVSCAEHPWIEMFSNCGESDSTMCSTACPVEALSSTTTPKIVHFIYLSEKLEDFSFIYYVALKSAKLQNPDYEIKLHSNVQPTGPYWNCVADFVGLERVHIPNAIFGVKINRVQHKVDVLRLEILLAHGGIYLDLDTVCVRPFDRFISNKVVMGRQNDFGLCNAVIVSPNNSEFLRIWYDGYREFHNDQWDEFSVKLPMKISAEQPDLIDVEPPETFFLPNFLPNSLPDLYDGLKQFPEAHVFHLWAYVAKEYIDEINIFSIFECETTYNLAARAVVGDDKQRLMKALGREPEFAGAVGEEVGQVRKVFEQIYQRSDWGTGSGNGSQPSSTVGYRAFLERFIVMNNVKSIVDVGCGDWHSSRYVCFNDARYTGFDVVNSIVDSNQQRFGSQSISFKLMPNDPTHLPDADLLIMKDVLQHLSNKHIFFYRDKIMKKFKFCLITNSWKAINYKQNGDISPGQFRSLDLRLPPYSFGGAYVDEVWNEWERIRTLLVSNFS
jgi:hypothetical protein